MKKVNEKRGDFGGKKNHPSIMSITRCLESLRDQITPAKNKNGSNNWEMKYFFYNLFSLVSSHQCTR
jgi:hypothetical protein